MSLEIIELTKVLETSDKISARVSYALKEQSDSQIIAAQRAELSPDEKNNLHSCIVVGCQSRVAGITLFEYFFQAIMDRVKYGELMKAFSWEMEPTFKLHEISTRPSPAFCKTADKCMREHGLMFGIIAICLLIFFTLGGFAELSNPKLQEATKIMIWSALGISASAAFAFTIINSKLSFRMVVYTSLGFTIFHFGFFVKLISMMKADENTAKQPFFQ